MKDVAVGLFRGFLVLVAGRLNHSRTEFWFVEKVVGLGETELEAVHELAAEFVILFTDGSKGGFCFRGYILGEGEGLEYFLDRIT